MKTVEHVRMQKNIYIIVYLDITGTNIIVASTSIYITYSSSII